MKNNRKLIAWILSACMALCGATAALAENTVPAAPTVSLSEFEALGPLMDLVAATVWSGYDDNSAGAEEYNAPESVPGAEGVLTNIFIDGFFRIGQTADPSMGITADMLSNTDQQAAYLSKVFAAQLPTLETLVPMEAYSGYIGFAPKTVNTAMENGGIQIIGEIYWAEKPLKRLTEAEYREVRWEERAIFSFQSDGTAMNGFRLTGFSVGTELDMELAMQGYFEEILVEYMNPGLGFGVQYPSIFTDDLLVEDQDGLSAAIPDGSASFFAKRVDNVSKANLQDYVNVIANGITGAEANVNDQFQYATVSYSTEDGYTVFDVYVVTDKYIYQAELSYKTSLADQFSMYTAYLENTFNVDEVSVG